LAWAEYWPYSPMPGLSSISIVMKIGFVGRSEAGGALPSGSARVPWDTVRVHAEDGEPLVMLSSVVDSAHNPWVIVFHGAANSVESEGSVEHYRILRDAGFNVLAREMRGYGVLSNVPPTESGIYADARTAWRFLIDNMKVDPQRVVLYGSSLGAAVATVLASEEEAAALMTNGAFTSAPDLVRHHYRWLPADILMHNRFDNLGRASAVDERWIIYHGSADEVVPVDHAHALAAAAIDATVTVFEGGHDAGLEQAYRSSALATLREVRAAIRD
jgi:uncharacterized protein